MEFDRFGSLASAFVLEDNIRGDQLVSSHLLFLVFVHRSVADIHLFIRQSLGPLSAFIWFNSFLFYLDCLQIKRLYYWKCKQLSIALKLRRAELITTTQIVSGRESLTFHYLENLVIFFLSPNKIVVPVAPLSQPSISAINQWFIP